MGKKLKRTLSKGRELRLRVADYVGLEKNLRSMDFFAGLTIKDRAMIMPYMRLFSYPKGSVIFREGAWGDRFYLIYKGAVDVFKRGSGARQGRVRLATLRPGEFFGEMALLYRQGRSATCTARGASEIFHLTKDDFLRILRKSPSVLRKVRRTAEKRLKTLAQAWSF